MIHPQMPLKSTTLKPTTLEVGTARRLIHDLKGQSCNLLPMPIRARHISTIIAISIAGFALGGCGTINEKLADGMGDYIPRWLGGLPADAPPRPGTAKYDEFMREREKKRLEPAPATDTVSQPSTSSSELSAVH
jgi:hypothetical protein